MAAIMDSILVSILLGLNGILWSWALQSKDCQPPKEKIIITAQRKSINGSCSTKECQTDASICEHDATECQRLRAEPNQLFPVYACDDEDMCPAFQTLDMTTKCFDTDIKIDPCEAVHRKVNNVRSCIMEHIWQTGSPSSCKCLVQSVLKQQEFTVMAYNLFVLPAATKPEVNIYLDDKELFSWMRWTPIERNFSTQSNLKVKMSNEGRLNQVRQWISIKSMVNFTVICEPDSDKAEISTTIPSTQVLIITSSLATSSEKSDDNNVPIIIGWSATIGCLFILVVMTGVFFLVRKRKMFTLEGTSTSAEPEDDSVFLPASHTVSETVTPFRLQCNKKGETPACGTNNDYITNVSVEEQTTSYEYAYAQSPYPDATHLAGKSETDYQQLQHGKQPLDTAGDVSLYDHTTSLGDEYNTMSHDLDRIVIKDSTYDSFDRRC